LKVLRSFTNYRQTILCRRIEELVGVPCAWIGNGPARAAMIAQPLASKVLVTA
jgi:adenylosuccinate synthase